MFPSVQTNTSELANSLANSQVNSVNQAGSKAYIQFDFKSGDFFYGREKEEITGEKIVVNTASFQHGWVTWVNGKPTKQMVGFTSPIPVCPAPIGGNTASEGRSFEARFTDDEDTVLSFDTNSYGGRKGCDTLLNAIKVKASKGSQYLFPIVQLESESYSSVGGIIHNPVFAIVDWMNQDGEIEGDTDVKAVEDSTTNRRTRRVA